MIQRCAALGLEPVAITDHHTIQAAIELSTVTRHRVIVGQEISTSSGELIGLFLQEPVPAGLPTRETALRIRDQGGLVYLQHPCDRFRRRSREDDVETIADLIDIVEVFNGRSDDSANRQAAELCEILGAAAGAGSDAQTLSEVGRVYVEMADFGGPVDFLAGLRDARIVTRPSRPLLWLRARTRTGVHRQ